MFEDQTLTLVPREVIGEPFERRAVALRYGLAHVIAGHTIARVAGIEHLECRRIADGKRFAFEVDLRSIAGVALREQP